MSNLTVPHGSQSYLAQELSRVKGGEAAKLRYVARASPEGSRHLTRGRAY